MKELATTTPDWIEALAQACEQTNQSTAARDIGYSPTVVNQVLKGVYKGNLNAVEKAVCGAFMRAVVECPIYGELESNQCNKYQRLPFAATNPVRVKLYRTCRHCSNNNRGGSTS